MTNRRAGAREALAPRFDPATMRKTLPPFDRDTWQVHSAQTLAYFAHYHLDLESRFQIVHHFGAVETCGYRIACHHFAQRRPRGSCIVTHGYLDHTGLYHHLIAHCLAQGLDVFAWDLPGHGLSSGSVASIDSFRSYTACLGGLLCAIGDGLPGPWLAVGQSTGGAVLLDYLLDPPGGPGFAAVTLLAPLVRTRGWRRTSVLYPLLRPFRRAVKRDFISNSSDADFLEFVRCRDPLQSHQIPLRWVRAMLEWGKRFSALPGSDLALRIVQGDADTTVDWRHNLPLLRAKFPAAEITLVDGAGHQLVNESPELRRRIFSAIGLSE